MKENKYDEKNFFMKYSEMERYQKGFKKVLENGMNYRKILPDF